MSVGARDGNVELDPSPLRVVSAILTFREIFDAHYEYVYTSLRRLGVRDGDIDDLVDDVFLRVHANLAQYDPARPARPWLFAFAVRAAADYRRLARHWREQGPPERERPDDKPDPEATLLAREEGALVHAALQAISESSRGVFIAYEIDGTDMREVAESLGIPLNTAYSRLRIARAAFAARVRELRQEEEVVPHAGECSQA